MAIKNEKKLNHAFELAKASGEIEGFQFTSEDEKIIKGVASGKISRSKLIAHYKKGE